MSKSPALSALLNFLLWGLGYLYLGKKTTFGVILVIGGVIDYVGLAFPSTEENLGYLMIILFSTFVIGLAFAYDAYQTAKEMQTDKTTISDEPVAKIKKEIPLQPSNVSSDNAYCSKCGNGLSSEDVFCNKCGTKLSS